MAEGDGLIYNVFKAQVLQGQFDLGAASGADEIKVMLVAGHTPDIDNHSGYSDVSGDEESGTGYTAGGEVLSGKSVTQDNGNDRGKFDGSDVTWTGLDVGTPSHVIMYNNTPASKYLIAYWELGRASNGGDYKLQWHADGIMLLT